FLRPGTASWSSVKPLALTSGTSSANPVMFPPGLGRLLARPTPTKSKAVGKMIGIVPVAFLAARAAGVVLTTIASTRSPTNSATRSNDRGREVAAGVAQRRRALLNVTLSTTPHDAVAPQAQPLHRPGPMDIPSSQTDQVSFATGGARRGRRSRTPP